MRFRLVGLVLMLPVLGGCAAWPLVGPVRTLLDTADRQVEQGDYTGALGTYEEIVAKHPDTRAAVHARVSREAVVQIVRLRQILGTREIELGRLREELARVRDELARTRDDLGRARHDVTGRQAEVARLTAETERLREDLEKLKQIDLRLEKRRQEPAPAPAAPTK